MNLSTLLQLQNLSIENIITRLYENGDLAPPTPQRPVVPLHHLIRSQSLKHVELSNLSSRAAMNSLVQHGALDEAWRGANSEALAGFLYANENGVWLFVRREDSIARRRFCAAHELGHYVLHFPRLLAQVGELSKVELIELLPLPSNPQADELSQGKLILQSSASDLAPLPDPDEMEHEADSFATELLMPEAIVRALAASFIPHCSDVDLARRLSTEMLVSRAAMLVRLRHLGLLRGEASLLD